MNHVVRRSITITGFGNSLARSSERIGLARTEITKVKPTDAGVNPTATVGQTDGHKFALNGDEVLVVKNSGASSRNFIVHMPRNVEGQDVPDRTIAIPAGATRYVGDLEPGIYGQPSGADRGMAYVNYDATAPAEVNLIVLDSPRAD
jgi:hypothetical protein